MKIAIVVGVAFLSVFASAQAPSKSRINEIWEAAKDRLSRQTDAWFKDGDYPRSIQLLRFHYELKPDDFEIGTNLGFMLENVNEDDKALAVYIELRKASPNDPDNAWPEAFFYYKKKAYAEIPPILEPTIKGHDPHPNNYRTLAEAYEKMKMYADAKRVFDLYLSRHPDDLSAKAHLARIVKKMKGGTSEKH